LIRRRRPLNIQYSIDNIQSFEDGIISIELSSIEVSAKTMNEKTEKNPESSGGAQPKWWELPFDSTTNFSLFGWLLDKFKGRRNEKDNVDLTLED
jgi:hypothetical protein